MYTLSTEYHVHKTIELPYDNGFVSLSLPDHALKAVIRPAFTAADEAVLENGRSLVVQALAHPIGTARLRELSRHAKTVTVITSDHTRSLPSAITLPLLLDEIRQGNPQADITIVVATGLHRGMTHDEMVAKFGATLVASERIVNHDPLDQANLVDLGTLPSGSKCEINRIAVESDLLVAEGFIEPHFFAGFSGGRKSVLPGIASMDCVNINHSAQAIQDPRSTTGVLDGNPIHEDMIVAARKAKLAFILNVLVDEKKQIHKAFAGDVDAAHRAGCAALMESNGVDPVEADVVFTTNGGYPLDQNLYQCPKGLASALACVKEGSVVVLVAACRDGLGGENFGRMMLEGDAASRMEILLAQKPEETISEQWCVQRFSQAMLKHTIILVSGLPVETVTNMGFIAASSPQEAWEQAKKLVGDHATATVIPDGVAVIPRRKKNG